LELPAPARIDHVILQEDCSAGQRIRAYRLEGRAQGNWQALGTGTAIGHKRIQPVAPVVAEAVRFVATESVGQGKIRRLAVFSTGSEPPSTWNA
jgi:alpha-L-fucosidase